MLVLAARLQDGPIHIINEDTGEEGIIQILGVKGGQVRIGFDFPKNHTVLRDTLYQRERNDD